VGGTDERSRPMVGFRISSAEPPSSSDTRMLICY
jgi:hypothetical protein